MKSFGFNDRLCRRSFARSKSVQRLYLHDNSFSEINKTDG
jgi:hypothetical protein